MVSKKEGRRKEGKEGRREGRKQGRKEVGREGGEGRKGRGGKGKEKERKYEEGRIRYECRPVFLGIIPRSESPPINLLKMVFPGPYHISCMTIRTESWGHKSPFFSLFGSEFPHLCREGLLH